MQVETNDLLDVLQQQVIELTRNLAIQIAWSNKLVRELNAAKAHVEQGAKADLPTPTAE